MRRLLVTARVRWGVGFLFATLAGPVFAEPRRSAEVEAPRPWVIAHRGASYDAPENTLAAFRLAWDYGADGFECDVWRTRDGEIVCLHDADTGRVGNGGGEKGSGLPVLDTELAAIQGVEVGSWKHARYADERPPTLAQALDLVPAGKQVFVEIKSLEGSGVATVPGVLVAVEQSGLNPNQVTVISFDADAIAEVSRLRADLRGNWLTSFKHDETGQWTPNVEEVLATLRRSGASGLGCKAEPAVVNEEFVRAIRSAGFEIHVWTVNDPTVAARFAELGVDSVTTDRPDLILETLSP